MPENTPPLQPGARAPGFTLNDVLTGQDFTLEDLRGCPVLLDFWSINCPWSQRYDGYFADRAAQWAARGITFWMIASNRDEAPVQLKRRARELGLPGPILHDPGLLVADAYGAQTTPHAFLIGSDGRLLYQGAVDDRSFRQREATTNYLDAAVSALLAGRSPDPASTPAYGCTLVRYMAEG